MSCDSTDQRRTHHQVIAGAAHLESDDKTCICDCAVVKAVTAGGKGALVDPPIAEKIDQANNNRQKGL